SFVADPSSQRSTTAHNERHPCSGARLRQNRCLGIAPDPRTKNAPGQQNSTLVAGYSASRSSVVSWKNAPSVCEWSVPLGKPLGRKHRTGSARVRRAAINRKGECCGRFVVGPVSSVKLEQRHQSNPGRSRRRNEATRSTCGAPWRAQHGWRLALGRHSGDAWCYRFAHDSVRAGPSSAFLGPSSVSPHLPAAIPHCRLECDALRSVRSVSLAISKL
uniref:Uncharacterized protein n=1 Tax=Anopheles dirus TaxID=7168 RepID=A0A182N0S5_9DIPT